MARVVRSGLREDGTPSSVMLGCAIGDIIPHMGTTAPPGTLVCDGSEVSREAYKELYKEIGALVGQGDGSTTFELPDFRGKWMMGADAEHTAGEEVAEGLPNITGQIRKTGGGGAIIAISSGQATVSGALSIKIYEDAAFVSTDTNNLSARSIDFDASGSNPIYGASDHVTPASVAVLPCIVYE